jgi:hypothetical protein
MHACLVLGILINPLLRPKLVDQAGIAMTPGTELGHVGAFDFSQKPALWTHGSVGVIQSRVSTMTVHTAKTAMLVDVCAKGLRWGLQVAFQGGVTFDTGVLGLETKRRKKPKQEEADPMGCETSHR